MLRLVLFILCSGAVVQWAPFVRVLWPNRTWPIRGVLVSLGGVLLYVLAGQAKAYELGVPFDRVSWAGLLSMLVLDVLLLVAIVRESARGKG